MVHDLPIAREKLDRAEPQILGPSERKDDVAIDIVAMGAKLRQLGLLENDVGGAEILLEGGVIGQRLQRRRVGGIPLWLSSSHPGLQHGNLGCRRRLRAGEIEVAFDLRRRHPAGLDLLEPDVDPVDRVVIGKEAERASLSRTVALLTVAMEKRQDVVIVGHGVRFT